MPEFTSFELQLVKVTSAAPSFTVANVYRPPSSSLSDFLDELDLFISTMTPICGERLVICGDVNAPGSDSSSINADLADVFAAHGLVQHVRDPTRENNILDVFVTGPQTSPSRVRVDDAGCVSDHRLVIASLPTRRQPTASRPVRVTYRNIRQLDLTEFEAQLRA